MSKSKESPNRILVDVFYYDYILSEAIRLYLHENYQNTTSGYLRIATILCKELRQGQTKLDGQLYLKEAYLKVLQMLRFYSCKFIPNKATCCLSVIINGLESIRAIVLEHPEIQWCSDFQTLLVVVLALHTEIGGCGRKEELERYPVNEFVVMCREKRLPSPLELEIRFTDKTALKVLETIHFEQPVMGKFVDYVKKGIDES